MDFMKHVASVDILIEIVVGTRYVHSTRFSLFFSNCFDNVCRIPNRQYISVKRMEPYCFEVIVRIVLGRNGMDDGSSKIRTGSHDTNQTREIQRCRQ